MTKQQIIKDFKNRMGIVYYNNEFYSVNENELNNAMNFYFNEYESMVKFSNVKDVRITMNTKRTNITEDGYLNICVTIALEFSENRELGTEVWLFTKVNA